MPFRAHFAKKEAREHQIAQNALAAGDLKQWHKHEAKAHRAGSHARGNGLMHTDYLMLGKENVAPPMSMMPPPMGAPMPMMGMPMMDNTPIVVGPQQSTSFVMPTSTSTSAMMMGVGGGPMMPPMELGTSSPVMPMMGGFEMGEYDMYGQQQVMPTNMIYEGGMTTMEPTIIMEPAIVEEPRTIVEYGEPIAPMMMMMGEPPLMPVTDATMMMPAAMSSASFTETQYGAPQFVGENVTMM